MNDRFAPETPGSGCLGFVEGRLGSILVYFVLLPLLVIGVLAVLFTVFRTPLFSVGYASITKTGVEVKDPDGTSLLVPEGAVKSGGSIKLSTTPQQAFLASPLAQSLPAYLQVKSPLYTFELQGERPNQATLSVPIPNDSEPYTTLDLWARYGDQWFKIPYLLNANDLRLESDLNFVPDSVVVAQTKPQAPVISAALATKNSPPADASKVLVQVNPTGLRLADEGALAGDILNLPETSASSPYAVVPIVTNVDETGPRIDLTENMMNDDTQRSAHIRTLVDLAVQKLYAGYNLAYEGLTPQDQDAYTAFIKELARQLHAQQKTLSITLPLPKPVSEDQWDTAGYDWALIGRYADEVRIPLMPDPHAYEGDTPLIEQYLQWAAGQIDRYKLQIVFSPLGRDESGDQFTTVAYDAALKLFGTPTVPQQIGPGETVTFDLPKLRDAGGIQYHDASGLFYFNYKDDKGAQHTVWLENADSLSKKVALLLKFNLHGVMLQGIDGKTGADPRIWNVLANYRSMEPSTVQSNPSVVWLVDGQVVGKANPSDPKLTWKAPDDAGQHTVDVALSIDNGESYTPGGQKIALEVRAKPTPVPTQVPTQAPTQAPSDQPKAKPTPKPATNPAPAPPAAVRVSGNNFGYGAQLNWTGSPLGPDGEFSTLNSMGFGWAKIQVRWCDIQGSPNGADLSSLDGITALAKAHGVKLLFSIVCGPGWSGARSVDGNPGPPDDPNQLGDFLNGISARYCNNGLGAIEVWNETNLSREWGPHPISGADYLRYLSVAYTRIKQACPSMIVVSGAPTPTGVNNQYAKSDDAYLQEMYSAGLKQYSDAIGIHPSGYNVPVDCDITKPTCVNTGQSWPAPWQSRHYSFSFLSMMNRYRNIMVANGDGGKQLWATEFGWGVTGSPFPGYEYERDNNADQQAQWLVKAYQYAKSWGWVGVMFVWNLDFTSGENGAFTILNRPAQAALAGMPK